jgi:hypothetical protein
MGAVGSDLRSPTAAFVSQRGIEVGLDLREGLLQLLQLTTTTTTHVSCL